MWGEVKERERERERLYARWQVVRCVCLGLWMCGTLEVGKTREVERERSIGRL